MNALLAALHYLALGLGFSGILLRTLELKSAREGSSLARVFVGDNLWGVAFLLWLITGLARAFMGFEKGSPYYLQNHWFWLKMTLFVLILALEIYPMITLIKWRIGKKKTATAEDISTLATMRRLSFAELHILAVIPFVASVMARGNLF